MRKVFLKDRGLPLLLILLLASQQAVAGYSDDADCKAVSDSAKASGNRALERIDEATTKTGAAIEQSKACVDQVLEQANRSVANFGGGGSLANFASNLLAKQSCKLLAKAQAEVKSQVANTQAQLQSQIDKAIPADATEVINKINKSLPNVNQAAGQAIPQAPMPPSVWQRLSNIF